MNCLIAGPCSAESQEQILQTAAALSRLHIPILRAGAWKPRTQPGQFEGYGEEALRWLRQAKVQFGVQTATEVALPEHVELAMHYQTDYLWIGARTTVNPFAVQQLAESLRGTGAKLLVKNPINPDLHLWMGAIRRLEQAGVEVVGAVHRGFSVYGATHYRFPPLWTIAEQLKAHLPHIQLIGDPSHMAGQRTLVPHITRQFCQRGYDGLMVECHPMPSQARSDAGQQLDLQALEDLLRTVGSVAKPDAQRADLQQLREHIDDIDDRLLTLIGERLATAGQLGQFKRRHHIGIEQPERFATMMEERTKWCRKHAIRPEFVHRLFQLLQQESIYTQQQEGGCADQ